MDTPTSPAAHPEQPVLLTKAEWKARFAPGKRLDWTSHKDEAIAALAAADPHAVWTEVDGWRSGRYIISGYHVVNRRAYYVAAAPCEPGSQYEIKL